MTRSIRISCIGLMSLVCSVCSRGQGTHADAWKLRLTSPNLSDTSRINLLNKISESYLLIDKDSTDRYASMALSGSEKANYLPGMAMALRDLGASELTMGTFDRAESFLKRAVEVWHKVGPGYEARQLKCLTGLGLSQWAQSKFDAGVQSYLQGERLAIDTQDDLALASIYSHLSALEAQRGRYKSSLEYNLKGMPVWRLHKEPGLAAICALAFVWNSVGDYQTSLQLYREGFRAVKKYGNGYDRTLYLFAGETYFLAQQYDSAAYCYGVVKSHDEIPRDSETGMWAERKNSWIASRMAEIHLVHGEISQALKMLNSSLLVFKKIKDNNQVMWVLRRLMNAHDLDHDANRSMACARSLLGMASRTGARQHIRDAHFKLFQLFEAAHKHDSAYVHLKKFHEVKEEIDSEQTIQRLAVFKSQVDEEKLQSRMEQNELKLKSSTEQNELKLQSRIEKNELKLEQASVERKFVVLIFILAALMWVFAYRNISLKRKDELHHLKSVEHELKLQKLETTATTAQLRQRATELEMQALRSQMNPHFIFNSLNSINRFILKNDRVQASQYLTTFSKLIRIILNNSLAPTITLAQELEGLALYLKLEALRFEQRFDYEIRVFEGLDPSALIVPPLFLQPYVENAIWHGLMHKEDKGHLEIDIHREGDQLCLRILDDGIGRQRAGELSSKSATRHKSLGLRLTADRIAHLSGSAEHSSVTINDLVDHEGNAAGTEVVIIMPLLDD